MRNPHDLHEERLATTKSDGSRIYLYPEEVKGKWQNYRSLVYFFLISFYLVLPWTKINGEQSFLIDIGAREFFIFGVHFYAHDIPLLFIVLAIFILSIGFLTAIFGRVWCGWACPQTVFIEAIFRRIESLVEGNSRKRMLLDKGPINSKKILKKIIKWLLFLFVSLVISHSFLAYFVRTEELIKIVQNSPEANYNLFFTMLFICGVFLMDFGWFREQFCTIACPYGRLQSILLDKDSLVVSYDYNRGEPRKVPESKDHADCINCYKCVTVCPTGIDIRRGTQLECIHCTRCIDACDEIMDHVNKPKGLIRYTTENQLQNNNFKIIRPRIIIYSIILLFFTSIGSYLIYQSKNVQVIFLRGTRSPYQIVKNNSGEKIVNHYKVELFYRDKKELKLSFKTNLTAIEIVSPVKNITLQSGRKKMVHVFFKFDKNVLKEGSKNISVTIYDGQKELITKEVALVGPYK
jgi:cytochrome c oxidase accessory protein FixG